MPAPKWFQKLRRRKKGKQQGGAACRGQQATDADADADSAAARVDNCPSSLPAAAARAVSPNRVSYYFATADRPRQDRELPCVADMALDVRVDVVHRRAGERRLGGLDAPPGTPELKLQRLVTRPAAAADASESFGGFSSASATTSAATTPSTRARGFHVKTAGGRRRHRRRRHDHDSISANKKGKAALAEAEAETETEASPLGPHGAARRRRRWLYESLVVVKASSDPEREMAESMAEMVVANGIRSSEDLEELLACYLALNAAEHHRAVVAAFRHVWSLLARHSLLL